jgi:TetR/AcrR family transcriptional repressor of mexJK operon
MGIEESRGRARPGRPRSEQKRDAILSAASDLFLENGIERTSMDAVAQRAGVSKQTVYSHFAGKEDLLTACVGCKLEAYDVVEIAHNGTLTARERLIDLASRLLNLIYDEGVLAMYRVIIGSANAHPELAKLFFEAGPVRTIDTFRIVIEQHVASGELAVGDCAEATDMLLGMLTGGPHMRSILGVGEVPDEHWRRAWVERCVDGFIAMFAAD